MNVGVKAFLLILTGVLILGIAKNLSYSERQSTWCEQNNMTPVAREFDNAICITDNGILIYEVDNV
jgi:hypothetical protein